VKFLVFLLVIPAHPSLQWRVRCRKLEMQGGVLGKHAPANANAGAIALTLMLAVLGLATTHRTRSDIEHQWLPAGFSADQINRQLGNMSGDAELNEWNSLLNQFHALVRKGSGSSEDIFDALEPTLGVDAPLGD
jgi:hypothetical protein